MLASRDDLINSLPDYRPWKYSYSLSCLYFSNTNICLFYMNSLLFLLKMSLHLLWGT